MSEECQATTERPRTWHFARKRSLLSGRNVIRSNVIAVWAYDRHGNALETVQPLARLSKK